MQHMGLNVWKDKTPMLQIDSAAYTSSAFLN